MTLRRTAAYGLGLIIGLAVLAAVLLLALGPFELAPVVAGRVAHRLGRPVTIAGLQVRVGTAVTVEMQDLVVANLTDASAEPFLKIARLDAEIAPWSLVDWAVLGHGPTIRHLSIDGAALLLEHGTGSRPNWRFGEGEPVARPDLPPRPDLRPQVPTLLDGRLHDAAIDLRTSSGQVLRVRLEEATIATAGADQPVTFAATGAYNDMPVQLSAALQSFEQLRKPAATPFGADVHLASDDTVLSFTGTLTKPLDADGAAGRFWLQAPTLDRLLAVGGVDGRAALPVTLGATVSREGALWHLTEGRGTLSGQPFQLDLQLREGVRHAPDDFTVDAGFSVLDLTGLDQGNTGETALRIDDAPGNLADAHIVAKAVIDGGLRAEDVDLKAKLAPGTLSVAPLTMRFAGGAGRVEAASTDAEAGAAVKFDGSLIGADPTQLARLLGLGPPPIAGTVDISASLRATGTTAAEAARSSSGGWVLSMQGGTIARNLVEQASTDIRSLFRKAEGVGQIGCLLAVVDLDNGIGRVAPLRLKTTDGTVFGSGTIDLRRSSMDITFASESASTSIFALDVPVRIAGPFSSPHAAPAMTRPSPAGATLGGLPSNLQDFARRNPCVSGTR